MFAILGGFLVKEEREEAALWHKERNGIRCEKCARRCFISKGKLGFCQIKQNEENTLYTLNYGQVVGLNTDFIEQAPMFHFYPKAKSLFFGMPGCNMFSDFCSSFELGHNMHTNPDVKTKNFTPESLVKTAQKEKASAIVYTFTEPFLGMEFHERSARIARRDNIKNGFVTNGYVTVEAVKKMSKYLDAAVINIKASADPEFYKKFMKVENVEAILDAIKQMKKQRIFMEITNTIVPQIGDNIQQFMKLAQWISSEISPEVPLHLLPFYPDYAMTELPATPTASLQNYATEATKAGMRYVYIDNSTITTGENTYCFNCRELLVERLAGKLKSNKLSKDRCSNCGVKINVVM
jgi:pyruvate formate lyase activating enzyme